MSLKDKLVEKGDSFASKKLGAMLGTGIFGPSIIKDLVQSGVPANTALYVVMGFAAVYIVVQGIVDYRKEGVKGILAHLHAALKDKEPSAPGV